MAPSRAFSRAIAPCLRAAKPSRHAAVSVSVTSATSALRATRVASEASRLHSAAIPVYPTVARRLYSSETSSASTVEPPDYLSEGELEIFNKLKKELEPVQLEVQDVSGGCGSMYALNIESPKFKGLSIVKQHKLVNEVLADDIKKWHGVQLRTKAA